MEFDYKFAFNVLLPLSSAAYSLPITKGIMPKGYSLVAPILVDGAKVAPEPRFRKLIRQSQYGWIYYNELESTLVVAYRGTYDFVDVIKDASIESQDYKCVSKYGEVHAGFQTVYFAIRDSVIYACRSLVGKYKRLVLTGHSLGAAVSELSAPDLYYQHLGIPEVINFAAPRVGKSDFIGNFDKDIPYCVRIVNRWDTVPRIPSLWTGYRHPGKYITFNSGFTLNALKAHSLNNSYFPGVEKLIG
jgi:triacylglycerol lipase